MTPGEIFFRTLSTPIVFVLVALGFHFFLRGHNAPGGGFIAGLIVAVAALITRMAAQRGLLLVRPLVLIPAGLLLAAISGSAPLLFGQPFLKGWHGSVTLPLFGQVELSSALAFDGGVFLVVIGATITIIDLLADDSELRRLGLDPETSPEGDGSAPEAED
ncbi:MAG TPA: MnhB domain-containing protein [Deinococcales bacterium]|nr:MnhB domain-containing protein [Deinococcales bacterium]